MNVLCGLFLPLRGKINLKTDAPDGIELGRKKHEKTYTIYCDGCISELVGDFIADGWMQETRGSILSIFCVCF